MTEPDNVADARVRLARSWDSAARAASAAALAEAYPDVEQAALPSPPGFVVWRIVGTRGCCMMPALVPHAPMRVKRAYYARILANLIGTCPICRECAWIQTNAPDPERTPAAWRVLDVTIGINHAPACSAEFTEEWRQWIDPRALGERS